MPEEQTPQTVQDPVAQDPTPAAQPKDAPAAPAPAPSSGPWAQDLARTFEDPAIRSQVDQFLRSTVQPYTTKLEQQTQQAEQAMTLWQALEQNPMETYVQMTRELYGEEAANAAIQGINQALQQQPQQTQQQAPNQQVPFDPRIQEAVNYYEQQRNAELYTQAKSETLAANPDIDPDLFDMYVAGAEGDFQEAVNLYRTHAAQWMQKVGTQQQTPETPQAPPVMGSDTGAAPTGDIPTQPKNQTLDEAINDFMAEQRANRDAPPVA
jgi:uncharacterized protein (DUF924 family)